MIIISNISNAQIQLAASNIPDSIKKNSDAVVRYRETTYRYKSDNKLLVTEHYAITVLNENGESMAILRVFYDADSRVRSIEGHIYNADGVKTTNLKDKDIQDYSAYASYTLFSDSRIKIANPTVKKYPYTVEYNYDIEYSKMALPPSWSPIDNYRESLEKASLSIYPNGNKILSRFWNISPSFTSSMTGDLELLRWDVEGIKAIDEEPYSPSFTTIQPKIFLTTESGVFYGYQASFTDWLNFGKLFQNLINDRGSLPQETVSEILKLCDGANTDVEKAKRVYAFVQNKVRYVNVSMGIGGFQPIEAQLVDKYGYGDCKALSNYTRALLRVAGVNSYYTIIGSGDYVNIKFPDFASVDQANHVILVVPFKSDTLWLECTSNKIPFGYIGGDNSNRYALAVTEDGGKLLKTPAYNSSDNVLSTVTNSEINASGDISISVWRSYRNELFDMVMAYLYESKQEQEKRLYSQLAIPGLKLNQFNFTNESVCKLPIGKLSYEANVLQYASISGNRLMFKPNILSKYQFKFTKATRDNDISIETGITMCDTINIKIPIGYKLEFDYQTSSLEGLVGTYESKLISNENNNLVYIRKFVINRGVYPKAKYKDISDFFKKVSISDNKSCVLIKS